MNRDCLEVDYNERLFERRGLRRFYHLARFDWAERKIAGLSRHDLRIIELGCFDGRLLERVRGYVGEYVGIDANWEGGLDQARSKFAACEKCTFIQTGDPLALAQFPSGHFDVAVCLETLEHILPHLVPEYLKQLSRITRGHLIVSVPNEIGLVFITKLVMKRLVYGAADKYSFKEMIAQTVGKTEAVERVGHKGFDYRKMIRDIAVHFDIIEVNGLPPLGLPPILSPTVGIVARH